MVVIDLVVIVEHARDGNFAEARTLALLFVVLDDVVVDGGLGEAPEEQKILEDFLSGIIFVHNTNYKSVSDLYI